MKQLCHSCRVLGLGALTAAYLATPTLTPAHAEEPDHPEDTIRVCEPQWKYPELARVTLENALEKAARAVPGDVLEVGLDDEDGFLVYDVKVATPDHGLMEVTIDAGTGEVLSTEVDEDED